MPGATPPTTVDDEQSEPGDQGCWLSSDSIHSMKTTMTSITNAVSPMDVAGPPVTGWALAGREGR
jgi:hypothetical protein